MAKPIQQHGRLVVAFGDLHIPYHNEAAVEVLKAVVRYLKPDLAVCLGDVMDCSQFSTHPPTLGMPETNYEQDTLIANKFFDDIQRWCTRLVAVEGNHEHRLDRWAARTAPGRGAYTMLAPRFNLARNRKRFTYIPYGSVDGTYPHYKIGPRVVAIHGWSYAMHATKKHLVMSQGKSIVHGHTHRVDHTLVQNVWSTKGVVQAISTGCLCRPVPLYGVGTPVQWTNAFVLIYVGRRSETMYAVPITGNRCVLPDGVELSV